MSAQFEMPTTERASCPLCGSEVAAGSDRCPVCGYYLAGVAGRAGPFTRPALWWSATALLIVYAVTLIVVAIAR